MEVLYLESHPPSHDLETLGHIPNNVINVQLVTCYPRIDVRHLVKGDGKKISVGSKTFNQHFLYFSR